MNSAPKQITGSCKLCLEVKNLQESHFMPAALYPRNLRDKLQFASIAAGILPSAREITAYALCSDCESTFDRNGEKEVMRWIAPKSTKTFPLADRLRVALPRDSKDGFARYAGYELGIDMDKFAYFAMSIVWRRTAIDWNGFDGTAVSAAPLGEFQEEIRQFLLHPVRLPKDMVVMVTVSDDKASRRVWTPPPSPEVFDDCINFRFLVRGVFFRILIGYGMPYAYRDMCCTSPRKCIFYGDVSRRMPEIMSIFEQTRSNN